MSSFRIRVKIRVRPPGRVLRAPEHEKCEKLAIFGPFLATCLVPVGELMLEPPNFNPVSPLTRIPEDSDEKLGVSLKWFFRHDQFTFLSFPIF